MLTITGSIACHETTAPSTELPVNFRFGFAPLAPSASLVAAGRDVIGVMVRTIPCNFRHGGSASLSGNRLDITVTLVDLGPVPCAVLPGASVDSVVVLGVPAGTYDTALHLRILSGGTAIDSTIAREAITKGS